MLLGVRHTLKMLIYLNIWRITTCGLRWPPKNCLDEDTCKAVRTTVKTISQYCKGYGLSTINICFNFRKLLCTSSHCNMWAWLCCTAWIGSFKTWISSSRTTAIWGGEYSSNRGIVWTRTNSQWWQHDNFLNKILRLPDIEICILVSQTNSYNYDWRVSPSSGSS